MWENIKEHIKVEDLKDRYLYDIYARNANIGIWIKERGSFLISRFKFDMNFLFEENHWDLCKHFGTVKPKKLIEKCPFENVGKRRSQLDMQNESESKKHLESFVIYTYENEIELLKYLNNKAKEIYGIDES